MEFLIIYAAFAFLTSLIVTVAIVRPVILRLLDDGIENMFTDSPIIVYGTSLVMFMLLAPLLALILTNSGQTIAMKDAIYKVFLQG